MAETVREAIDEHIAARAADEKFRARLAASIERNRRILDRLAKTRRRRGGGPPGAR